MVPELFRLLFDYLPMTSLLTLQMANRRICRLVEHYLAGCSKLELLLATQKWNLSTIALDRHIPAIFKGHRLIIDWHVGQLHTLFLANNSTHVVCYELPDNVNCADLLGYFMKSPDVVAHNNDTIGVACSTRPMLTTKETEEYIWLHRTLTKLHNIPSHSSEDKKRRLSIEGTVLRFMMGIKSSDEDSIKYVSDSQRKEWVSIALEGEVFVRDNGQCQIGRCCDCENGIAVPGTKWQVLERNNSSIIKIFYQS